MPEKRRRAILLAWDLVVIVTYQEISGTDSSGLRQSLPVLVNHIYGLYHHGEYRQNQVHLQLDPHIKHPGMTLRGKKKSEAERVE